MNTILSRRVPILSLLILLTAGFVLAQEKKAPPFKLTVRAERESAIYQKGETVLFQVRLLENNKPLAGKTLHYVVQGDGKYEKKGTLTSAEEPVAIEASLDKPGLLKCTVNWNDAPGKALSALGGAAVDPLDIRSGIAEPADFDAFWNAKKKALAELPMNPKLVKVDAAKVKNDKVEVYDIKVDCLGGAPLSGYFAKPVDAKPKSLPILVTYHGAGVRSSNMPIGSAARGVLALDINAHGIENGHPEQFYKDLAAGRLKDYRFANQTDRDKQYFVGMYLRVIRALQFMKAQPEWDGKTVVVSGGSQGGGQALAAAGLDPDVDFCVAYVPALCYPLGGLEGNFDGWPGFLRGKTKEDHDPEIARTVPYVDAALHAKRIKAESILTVGFVDYVCSPTSVYMAYNNIKAPKYIIPMPEAGHSGTPAAYAEAGKRLWDFIEKSR